MKVKRIIALALLFTLCLSIIATAASGDTIVYITDTGEKYHRISCGSLWNSQHAITLQQAINRGYEACQRCSPPKYVTSTPTPYPANGNRWEAYKADPDFWEDILAEANATPTPTKSLEERLEAMRATSTPTPTPTPEPERKVSWESVGIIAIVFILFGGPYLIYIIVLVVCDAVKSRRRAKETKQKPRG